LQKPASDLAWSFPDLFSFLLRYPIQTFLLIVEEWVIGDNINEFQPSPLHLAVESIGWDLIRTSSDVDLWKSIIQKLVRIGANIHHFSNVGKDRQTLLDRLFREFDPFVSKSVAAIWLGSSRCWNRSYGLPRHRIKNPLWHSSFDSR